MSARRVSRKHADRAASERACLIAKQHSEGLTAAEQERLAQVTAVVDDHLRPLHEADIAYLKTLISSDTDARLAAIRRRLSPATPTPEDRSE